MSLPTEGLVSAASNVQPQAIGTGSRAAKGKTVLIDNYDSFTYNVVQFLAEAGADLVVYRNDKVTLEELEALNPANIVISPGPVTLSTIRVSRFLASSHLPAKSLFSVSAWVCSPSTLPTPVSSSSLARLFTAKPPRSLTTARVFTPVSPLTALSEPDTTVSPLSCQACPRARCHLQDS